MTDEQKAQIVRELMEAAMPFLDWRVVDETSGTIPLMERLEQAIEEGKRLLRELGDGGMMPGLSPVQRETLEWAAKDCIGAYGVEHILAAKELVKTGLLCHVESTDTNGHHAYFAITEAGRQALAEGGD